MQLILDNIIAALVYSSVALVVISTQFSASQTTVESTISYMSKKQILELGATLEQELKLIGQGTTNKITQVINNADGQTTQFTFWRNNGVSDLKIEFRLVATDTIMVNGDPVKR